MSKKKSRIDFPSNQTKCEEELTDRKKKIKENVQLIEDKQKIIEIDGGTFSRAFDATNDSVGGGYRERPDRK